VRPKIDEAMSGENELPQDIGPQNIDTHVKKEESVFFIEERLLQNKVLKLMIEKIKDPDSPISARDENTENA
jgi:hypothetical protein